MMLFRSLSLLVITLFLLRTLSETPPKWYNPGIPWWMSSKGMPKDIPKPKVHIPHPNESIPRTSISAKLVQEAQEKMDKTLFFGDNHKEDTPIEKIRVNAPYNTLMEALNRLPSNDNGSEHNSRTKTATENLQLKTMLQTKPFLAQGASDEIKVNTNIRGAIPQLVRAETQIF